MPAKLRDAAVDADEILRIANLYVGNAARYHAELRRIE